MKAIIIFLSICFAAACSAGANYNDVKKPSKEERIEAFWKWFVDNQQSFENLPRPHDSESVHQQLDQIRNELIKISDGLVAEVSKNQEGFRDLTISAEGDKDKFPIVREIVDKAPQIQGWNIVAFRQRAPIAFVLETPSIRYSTDEMFFEPLIDGSEFDAIVYAPDLKQVDEKKAFHFGIIVMDNLLGEYDSAMKVRRYDFRDVEEVQDRKRLKPLSELPNFVDDFYERHNN